MARSIVRTVAILVAVGSIASCEGEAGPIGPEGPQGAQGATGPTGAQAQPSIENFTSTLNAANEVPPTTSTATGTASISRVGATLLYRIDVTNITNVTAAHLHGPALAGVNAGVHVNLCGAGSGAASSPACATGAVSGVLVTGVATSVSGFSLDSMLVLLRNGNAYVNVHTNDNVAPTNTGPGDFPGGEIRGQVVPQ